MESSFAGVPAVCDFLHIERKPATFFSGVVILSLSSFSAFGYGAWSDVRIFGLQFLDFFDFITNSVLMPIFAVALRTAPAPGAAPSVVPDPLAAIFDIIEQC